MCILVPNAALLKVFFHWGSAIETIFFCMDNDFPHTSSGTVWGRFASLLIEAPISIFQLVNLIIAFCKMGILNKQTELYEEEWHEIVRQCENSFWIGIPNLINIFLAKQNRDKEGVPREPLELNHSQQQQQQEQQQEQESPPLSPSQLPLEGSRSGKKIQIGNGSQHKGNDAPEPPSQKGVGDFSEHGNLQDQKEISISSKNIPLEVV